MTTYERRASIEAMQWNGHDRALAVWGRPGTSAELIIRWIEANGGEARFERAFRIPECFGAMEPAKIIVRTTGGWLHVRAGEYVVMGEATFDSFMNGGPVEVRPFFRMTKEQFETEGWQAK